jgi:hypothetical protein
MLAAGTTAASARNALVSADRTHLAGARRRWEYDVPDDRDAWGDTTDCAREPGGGWWSPSTRWVGSEALGRRVWVSSYCRVNVPCAAG